VRPGLVGAIAFFVVFASVWLIPLKLDEPNRNEDWIFLHPQLVGEVWKTMVDTGDTRNQTHTWELDVNLPGDPKYYDVFPSLLYNVTGPRWPEAPEGQGIFLYVHVFANGEEIAHAGATNPNSGIFRSVGTPTRDLFYPDPPWREGHNAVRIEFAIHALESNTDKDGRRPVEVGPVRLDWIYKDTDYDGITNAHQPVHFIPTHLLALAAGIVPGSGAAWLAKRRPWR